MTTPTSFVDDGYIATVRPHLTLTLTRIGWHESTVREVAGSLP